jgi:hypothetical protein
MTSHAIPSIGVGVVSLLTGGAGEMLSRYGDIEVIRAHLIKLIGTDIFQRIGLDGIGSHGNVINIGSIVGEVSDGGGSHILRFPEDGQTRSTGTYFVDGYLTGVLGIRRITILDVLDVIGFGNITFYIL